MQKKILLGAAALVALVAGVVGISAFEAHVINVTAQIENALQVQTEPIQFGTVFPEELLLKNFTMKLSDSFLQEPQADDVEYHIKQKDKPRDPREHVCLNDDGTPRPCNATEQGISSTEYCHKNRPADPGNPADPYYTICYPNLCPYLSKDSDDDEGTHGEPGDNDGSIAAFHRAECDDKKDNDGDLAIDWPADPQCTSKYDDSEIEPEQQGLVKGILAKSLRDIVDLWTIDLHVPCFKGQCAQDNVIPADYQLDPRLEHAVFGCDLWIEVDEISRFPECSDTLDNDGDLLIDAQDPQCKDAAGNYNPLDNDESN